MWPLSYTQDEAQFRRTGRDIWLLNSYRVLLTRARKGMVIWVPAVKGKWMLTNPTLDPNALDEIADLLMESGVPLA